MFGGKRGRVRFCIEAIRELNILRAAIKYLLIVVSILGISCAAREENRTRSSNDTKLELTIRLGKTAYALGSPVDFSIVVRNISPDTVHATFPSACHADFAVMRDGAVVWNFMHDRHCAQIIGRATIAPGDSASFDMEWDGLSTTPGNRISMGRFTVKGILLTNPQIETEPVEFYLVD